MKFTLTWGESIAVRQAFINNSHKKIVNIDSETLLQTGYTMHEGNPEFIENVRKIIKRQIGLDYKHIVITNGASGAIPITLRAYKQQGVEDCLTNIPPFFSVYPKMISAAGLGHIVFRQDSEGPTVALIDSPGNPLGDIYDDSQSLHLKMPIIWDAVYHNNVYTPGNMPRISHDILLGSFSKLTGINGIRLGWIATNDDLLYERIKDLTFAEYCGLSYNDFKLANHLIDGFDWEKFEKEARDKLDSNRYEWSKLEKYFGNTEVSKLGMFYFGFMDKSCKKLMNKSGVEWMPGSNLGAHDDFGRFNLGASCETIKDCVKEILKVDKIKSNLKLIK